MATLMRPQAQAAAGAQIEITECQSKTKSANLVKRLMCASLSTVAYLRNLFSEECFGTKDLEDISMKVGSSGWK